MTDKILTLHQGGTGEREIAISSITVPDLWHVATRLREAEHISDAQLVMDCWHLAHAMKDHLQQQVDQDEPPRNEAAWILDCLSHASTQRDIDKINGYREACKHSGSITPEESEELYQAICQHHAATILRIYPDTPE